MFGGFQAQLPYHAGMNGILTFKPWYQYIKKTPPPQACRGDVSLLFYQDLTIRFDRSYCRKMLHKQIVGRDSNVEKITIFVANGEST